MHENQWRRLLGQLAGLDEPYRGRLGPKRKRHAALANLFRDFGVELTNE
jgi:hypothetical protein